MENGIPLSEQGDIAHRFLAGVVDSFGLTANVEQEELDEETLELSVKGDGLGLLIGPKGATLSALQELTRTVVQRQSGGRVARLLVDVGGYRQKRQEALDRFARQVAAEVSSTGTEQSLEPMSPADRKVIHDAVNEIPGVTTRSEGEEPKRCVVISPE